MHTFFSPTFTLKHQKIAQAFQTIFTPSISRASKTVISGLLLAFALGFQVQANAAETGKADTNSAQKTVKKSAKLTAIQHQFEQTTHQFINALLQQSPEMAISFGKFNNADKLTIPNDQERQKMAQFATKWLAKFEQFKPEQLTDNQNGDWVLLKNMLQETQWQLSTYRDYEWDPSQYNIAGELDGIINTDYAPMPTRLKAVTQRLKNVPAYYAAARANIVRPTKEHTELAIQQATGTIAVLDQITDEAKKVGAKLAPQDQKVLAERIQIAKQEVQKQSTWLTDLAAHQTEQNTRTFRIGAALYEAKFGYDMQSRFSAKQLYERALQAKENKLAEMDKLADELWTKTMGEQVKPSDRLQKIKQVIDQLSANHTTAARLIPEVRAQIPMLEKWITDHDLLTLDATKPLVVRETPEYQRGVSVASLDSPGPFAAHRAAYYNVSPLEGQSPEQIESALREYNHWILQILSIHEGVPGHYVQLLHSNKSPSLVKKLFGNGAMIEGWAVYGERMMMESGYGDNTPEMWLMYDKWNLRAICNTILDYSVHVNGMSQADAMHLLTNEAFQSQAEAAGKWRRVQLTSVQLDSYFSGYAEIMALREERKQALGNKFNLKQFHEQFLSYGSAPVRMIRELMSK